MDNQLSQSYNGQKLNESDISLSAENEHYTENLTCESNNKQHSDVLVDLNGGKVDEVNNGSVVEQNGGGVDELNDDSDSKVIKFSLFRQMLHICKKSSQYRCVT